MKNTGLIEVEYVSIMEKGTHSEYAAISIAEFKTLPDAIAFIQGLPKDKRITQVSELPGISNAEEYKINDDIISEHF